MDANSQRPRHQDGALSSLNAAIEAMNLAKEVSRMTLASAIFGLVGTLLTTIRARLLFCGGGFLAHVYLGLGGQQELCWARASMRRRVQSP